MRRRDFVNSFSDRRGHFLGRSVGFIRLLRLRWVVHWNGASLALENRKQGRVGTVWSLDSSRDRKVARDQQVMSKTESDKRFLLHRTPVYKGSDEKITHMPVRHEIGFDSGLHLTRTALTDANKASSLDARSMMLSKYFG